MLRLGTCKRGLSAKAPPSIPLRRDTQIVYTDGSCRMFPNRGWVAGIGVYWGKDDSRYIGCLMGHHCFCRCRNISLEIRGPPKVTHSRAEIMAAIEAIKAASREHPLVIRTDSEYVIKGKPA